MDFTEDPFKDYRYEDPFNIDDPFAAPERRPTSAAAFDAPAPAPAPPRGGRESAPPTSASTDAWAAWPNDNWADAWPEAPKNKSDPPADWKTDNWAKESDNWAKESDNWATDWNTDHNKNLNETWPSNTLPGKKEKSPKPVKYAKSLVHTIGGIGRARQKEKKAKLGSRSAETLPSEEQQWAWAAAESARLQAEAAERRRREDAELQLALAISRRDQ